MIILTEDGAIPMEAVVQKGRDALQTASLAFPIEEEWRRSIARGDGVRAVHWPSKSVLLVGANVKRGGLYVAFVANTRTGAWARNLGWDMRAAMIANDRFFFADRAGVVYEGDVSGNDNGMAYRATYAGRPATFNEQHFCNSVQLMYSSPTKGSFNLQCFSDYEIGEFVATDPLSSEGSSNWGSGVWGTFVWGGQDDPTFQEWQAAYGRGYALAPAVTVQCLQDSKPTFEIIATRMRVERGTPL